MHLLKRPTFRGAIHDDPRDLQTVVSERQWLLYEIAWSWSTISRYQTHLDEFGLLMKHSPDCERDSKWIDLCYRMRVIQKELTDRIGLLEKRVEKYDAAIVHLRTLVN